MSGAGLWPEPPDVLDPDALALIAAHASRADADGRAQDASLDALRERGYFSLPIPTDFEGRGAGLGACATEQHHLARADAALAVATNMHLFSVGVMVQHWRLERDTSWLLLEAIATQDRIVASGFAEPSIGGNPTRSTCLAQPTEGGWSVSGVKTPCSFVGRADLVCFQMQAAAGGAGSLMVCLVPTSAPGLAVERSWDGMGLRGSESDTLRIDRCEIPDDLVFHRSDPGALDDVLAGGLVWFCVLCTATYLGVAAAAVDAATAAARRSRVSHLGGTRADLPANHGLLGDAMESYLTLQTACRGLAATVDAATAAGDPIGARLPEALALRASSMRLLSAFMDPVLEVAGASESMLRGRLLERAWRDLQGVRFHAPNRPAIRQILGRWAFGSDVSFDDDGRATASGCEPEP